MCSHRELSVQVFFCCEEIPPYDYLHTVCVHVQYTGCQCMVDACVCVCVCVHLGACLGVGEAYCDCSELLRLQSEHKLVDTV